MIIKRLMTDTGALLKIFKSKFSLIQKLLTSSTAWLGRLVGSGGMTFIYAFALGGHEQPAQCLCC
jgi:hypothetical protein